MKWAKRKKKQIIFATLRMFRREIDLDGYLTF